MIFIDIYTTSLSALFMHIKVEFLDGVSAGTITDVVTEKGCLETNPNFEKEISCHRF